MGDRGGARQLPALRRPGHLGQGGGDALSAAPPQPLLARLACPRDRLPLEERAGHVACGAGHEYPLVGDVPVLLLDEPPPTHAACGRSLRRARRGRSQGAPPDAAAVDAYVSAEILETHGNLYRHLVGALPRYPIPRLRLPAGGGRTLLDVGCNWGRWSVAAARAGYRPLGVDPRVEAVLAARRVARSLGADAGFAVGDARHLPLPDDSVDVAFSYSVLQHFGRDDALAALRELRRVTRPGGTVLVQMANALGSRNLLRQARRGRFREPVFPFDVRYWTPRELLDAFEAEIGPTRLHADCFFALNAQPSDVDLLPPRYRALVGASELLRRVPPLARTADSVYLEARVA